MNSIKNTSVYGILLLIFVLFIVLIVFAGYIIGTLGKSDGDDSEKKSNKIGVVEVNGIIMESRPIIELLQKAEKDDNIKAIIVRINSPGGAVSPTQEIYEEMRRIDESFDPKKEEGRPVYASLSSIAASGGYYIGSAARKIYANPGTLTGSIGVIMSFVDMTKLYEWAKLRPEVIKSGRFKDVGSPHRAMLDEERKLLEEMALNVHEQFVGDVLSMRKEKIKGDIKELTDGKIFSGEVAFERGLVDELAGLWKAGRKIHEELKLEGELNLTFIQKRKKRSFLDIIEQFETIIGHINWKGVIQPTPMFLVQ